MGKLSVGEISSLIPEIPKRRVDMDKDDSPVHKNWDPVTRSALVILWGLLVYPRLDPDLRKREKEPIADRDFVYEHFQEHFGSREKWEEILTRLKQYDYIRFRDGGKLTAGTRLLTTVDAAKMYEVYRTSVLVRRLIQLASRKNEN